jgi:hypothetical protein
MKKLALVSAIAAATTFSTGAHAVVGSDITGIVLKVGGVDIATDCSNAAQGFHTGLGLSGLTPWTVHLSGNVCLDPNQNGTPYVAINFGLGGKGDATGTKFSLDGVSIWTDMGTTSGWSYYATINAGTTNIPCMVMGGLGGLPLPGGVNVIPNTGPTCSATFFGNAADLYLTGSTIN